MTDPAATGSDTLMSVLQPYMPVFYVSFLVTLILTPIMRILAQQHGIVDDPDGKRKIHSQPIAYLGGVATFLGWLAGVSVSVMLRPHNAGTSMVSYVQVPPGIILGAAVVVFFGLMDDVYSLSPRIKLLGQFLAACFLIIPGKLGMGRDFFFGDFKDPKGMVWMVLAPLTRLDYINIAAMSDTTRGYVSLGAMFATGALAIFIIISTCNATNLLDGLDGLCSGVTGVMSAGYLILALYLASVATGLPEAAGSAVDPTRITLSLALLGAVAGFLPFNFNPASIFMGDTGSMFLGYICGTMILLFGQDAILRWFLAAIVIFGLPLMDTLLAIVRRKLNGQPIFSPDSNHFHHFLIKHGFTVRRAVLLSYGLAALFVSFALVIVIIPTRLALGLYLVLFAWLVVAAFKMGMIFQQKATPTNAVLNAAVLNSGPAVVTTPGAVSGEGEPAQTPVAASIK